MEIKQKLKDVKLRVILKLIVELIKRSNREVPISDLQKRFNAYEEKTTQFLLTDKNLSFAFRITKGGRLVYVKRPRKIDSQALMTSDTFIALISNQIKRIDMNTDKTYLVPYSIQDAWLEGSVQTYDLSGKGRTTNDMFLAFQIFQEIQKKVGVKIGQRIAGALM